ncbi:MAG TPA: hypothetical protein VNX21_01775, partial [Candidatus Thermoplasmatota archaeon]|nr:hypothetical protein [Candidatus Thermoplasmatota archaeon]
SAGAPGAGFFLALMGWLSLGSILGGAGMLVGALKMRGATVEAVRAGAVWAIVGGAVAAVAGNLLAAAGGIVAGALLLSETPAPA